MNSDRFVLVAPYGYTGAVAGLIGNLQVHESPTFKNLSGIGAFNHKYSPTNLKELLKANILALEAKKGKGIIIEKGIATSGEQISVTRVADRAVRGTKLIGDQFIGIPVLDNSFEIGLHPLSVSPHSHGTGAYPDEFRILKSISQPNYLAQFLKSGSALLFAFGHRAKHYGSVLGHTSGFSFVIRTRDPVASPVIHTRHGDNPVRTRIQSHR